MLTGFTRKKHFCSSKCSTILCTKVKVDEIMANFGLFFVILSFGLSSELWRTFVSLCHLQNFCFRVYDDLSLTLVSASFILESKDFSDV